MDEIRDELDEHYKAKNLVLSDNDNLLFKRICRVLKEITDFFEIEECYDIKAYSFTETSSDLEFCGSWKHSSKKGNFYVEHISSKFSDTKLKAILIEKFTTFLGWQSK